MQSYFALSFDAVVWIVGHDMMESPLMESNVGQVRTFQELKYSKDYVIFRICYYISEIGDLFPLSKPQKIQPITNTYYCTDTSLAFFMCQ